ncbi:MAG: hypothetical protein ACTSU9_15405, partial [Promethearchaeota archaeon]
SQLRDIKEPSTCYVITKGIKKKAPVLIERSSHRKNYINARDRAISSSQSITGTERYLKK